MKQAHKKRPHLAAANSPPELPDMGGGNLFYKSGKFIRYEHFYSSNFTTPIRHKYSIYQRIVCLNVIILHLL